MKTCRIPYKNARRTGVRILPIIWCYGVGFDSHACEKCLVGELEVLQLTCPTSLVSLAAQFLFQNKKCEMSFNKYLKYSLSKPVRVQIKNLNPEFIFLSDFQIFFFYFGSVHN